MKRDQAALRRALEDERACRVCGSERDLHAHHIVFRSSVQCDERLNIAVLCFDCHRSCHAREFDLGAYLTPAEQAHAVSLIGLGVAHDLLFPSASAKRVAA